MALQDHVSDNVRILAAAQHTSPGALAERVGRTRQWIQAKLAGRNGWSVTDVELVSRSLGVDPALLMSIDWWPEQLLRARRDSNPKPSVLSVAA
jgi:hypothetical protein